MMSLLFDQERIVAPDRNADSTVVVRSVPAFALPASRQRRANPKLNFEEESYRC
jgi:hypothetical protein